MIEMKKRLALMGTGFGAVGTFLALTGTAHAADYSASTTAAITSAGESVLSMFFTNLPVILTFVIAISLTLWGINWVMGHFTRGRKR